MLSHPFPPLALRRRHCQTACDGASSHKVDYVTQVYEILNLNKNQSSIILIQKLRWCFFLKSIGVVASVKVCAQPALQAWLYYDHLMYNILGCNNNVKQQKVHQQSMAICEETFMHIFALIFGYFNIFGVIFFCIMQMPLMVKNINYLTGAVL